MKKLLALACSLVICLSMIASTALVADAAVEGVTATLEFAGYETIGTNTFAYVKVLATIPDTLVPYKYTEADWGSENPDDWEDRYEGKMLQGVGFDIPYVDGLTYVKGSKSPCASYVQIQDNKTASKLTIYAANSGAYETYYAGEVNELATICYRITGDVNAEYAVDLAAANIGLVDVAVDGTVTPYGYKTSDFTITNAVIKPETQEPEEPAADVITKVASDVTAVIDAPYWQKGQGAMIEFNTADLADFVAMNWVLNLKDGTKKFAKADFSLDGVGAPTVQFFATFVVNENADDAGFEIASVDAGFKKAEGDTVYKTFAE